jgi:hypothetical protein
VGFLWGTPKAPGGHGHGSASGDSCSRPAASMISCALARSMSAAVGQGAEQDFAVVAGDRAGGGDVAQGVRGQVR